MSSSGPLTPAMQKEVNNEVLLEVLITDFMNHQLHGWEVAAAFDWDRMQSEYEAADFQSSKAAALESKLAAFQEPGANLAPMDILKRIIIRKALPISGANFGTHDTCAGTYWRPVSREKQLLCVASATPFDTSTRISPVRYLERDRLLELLAQRGLELEALTARHNELQEREIAISKEAVRAMEELQASFDEKQKQLTNLRSKQKKILKKKENERVEREKTHATEQRRLLEAKQRLQADKERAETELGKKTLSCRCRLLAVKQRTNK